MSLSTFLSIGVSRTKKYSISFGRFFFAFTFLPRLLIKSISWISKKIYNRIHDFCTEHNFEPVCIIIYLGSDEGLWFFTIYQWNHLCVLTKVISSSNHHFLAHLFCYCMDKLLKVIMISKLFVHFDQKFVDDLS